MLANIVGRDLGSVTGKNLYNIEREFGLDPWRCYPGEIKRAYCYYMVPEMDMWRLPLLVKLLDQKLEMETCEENTKTIRELIDSLCTS